MYADATVLDVSSEVVQPNVEVFRSWPVFVLLRDFDCTRVVLEHFAVDFGFLVIYFESAFIIGMASLRACDRPLYSAFVVLIAILLCN